MSDARTGAASRNLLYEKKFTVPKAARMLGVGETKMRQIIARGEIAVFLMGNKCLVFEGDLQEFIQGRHGPVRAAEIRKPGLPPLPRHILKSDLLKEGG